MRKKKSINSLILLTCAVSFIASLPLVSKGLDAWHYHTSDAIDRAGIDTERKIARYEQTQDARELRLWLTDGPEEALGTQVRATFGRWSLTHATDFTLIVEGLPTQKKRRFVEWFADTLGQSGQFNKFCVAFQGSKSKVVKAIIKYGRPNRPLEWPVSAIAVF